MSVSGYSAYARAEPSPFSSPTSPSTITSKAKEKELRMATQRRRNAKAEEKRMVEEKEIERRESALEDRRKQLSITPCTVASSGVRLSNIRKGLMHQNLDDVSVGNTTITTAGSDRYISRGRRGCVPLPVEVESESENESDPVPTNVMNVIEEGEESCVEERFEDSMEADSLCGSPNPNLLDESGFDRVASDVHELRSLRRRMREGEDVVSVMSEAAGVARAKKHSPGMTRNDVSGEQTRGGYGQRHKSSSSVGNSPLPPPPGAFSEPPLRQEKKFGIGFVTPEEASRRELLARQKQFAKQMQDRNAAAFRKKLAERAKRETARQAKETEQLEQQRRDWVQAAPPPVPLAVDDMFSTMKAGGNKQGFKTGITMSEEQLMRSLARLDFRLEEKKAAGVPMGAGKGQVRRRKKKAGNVVPLAPPPQRAQRAPLIDLNQMPVYARAPIKPNGANVFIGEAYDALVTPARLY